MDNRLLTFASVYELRSMAAPAVPVEPVVRPGMGARVMEGLSGAAGRLGEVGSAIGRGYRALTEVPANVRALTESRTGELSLNKATGEFEGQPQPARVRYDAGTKKIVGADTPEEIAALKGEGFSDFQIQQARNLAMRSHYESLRNTRAAQKRESRQRTIDQGRAMFTKGLSGSHLQAKLTSMSPAGKTGMLVMTGLSVLYYLFSGKKPNAATEDGQAVLMDVPPTTESIIPNIITEIDSVIEVANRLSKPDIASALNTTKTSLNTLPNSSLTIDEPTSGQAFAQNVKNAEGSVNTALSQLEVLVPALTDQGDIQKVQDLKASFSDFLIEILDVRGMQS
jgi:hypothetical protein